MKLIAWDEESNTAIEPERMPLEGEYCNYISGDKSRKCHYSPPPDLTNAESQWCDFELEKITVSKMKIYRDEIIVYKSNLKNNLPVNGRPQKP